MLSPEDGTLYTYMQGMNAPMAGGSPRGHPLRAVRVARQGLLPAGRGRFEATVTLPGGPAAVLALATERPAARFCLRAALAPDEADAEHRPDTRIAWRVGGAVGASAARRLELVLEGGAQTAWPRTLAMALFRPGGARIELVAEPSGRETLDAATVRVVYAARTAGLAPGVYYAHVVPTADGPVTPALARQFTSIDIEPEAR